MILKKYQDIYIYFTVTQRQNNINVQMQSAIQGQNEFVSVRMSIMNNHK